MVVVVWAAEWRSCVRLSVLDEGMASQQPEPRCSPVPLTPCAILRDWVSEWYRTCGNRGSTRHTAPKGAGRVGLRAAGPAAGGRAGRGLLSPTSLHRFGSNPTACPAS